MINFGSKGENSIFLINNNIFFLFSVSRAESERKMLNPETGCYSESVRAW